MDDIENEPAAASIPDSHVGRAVALIERWFAEHFHNSPISRDTQCWNHAVRAKDRLIKMLSEL
jgi:hypothetical protein